MYRQKPAQTGGRREESTSSATAGNVWLVFQRGKKWLHDAADAEAIFLMQKLKKKTPIISGYSRHFLRHHVSPVLSPNVGFDGLMAAGP